MKKDEKMSIEDMTAYMRIVPERKASYAEFPDTMNDEIKEYLGKQGINALYTHQTEMFEKAGRGENTVITTSTGQRKNAGISSSCPAEDIGRSTHKGDFRLSDESAGE